MKGDRARILFFSLNQLEMRPGLFFAFPRSLVPSIEHLADRNISRIAGHPNLAVIIYLIRMVPVKVVGSTFGVIVSVLIDCVFIVIQVFSGVTSGKGLSIRKSTGYFE